MKTNLAMKLFRLSMSMAMLLCSHLSMSANNLNITCGNDPCDVPCPDCVTITADAITETGSAPFSIVYDAATNGSNTQTVAVVIQTPNVPPCASVDFDYTINYTIDPFTPSMGISWTSEASFEIQDLAGNIISAQGPNLPGSANNGSPISGSANGSSTTMAGSFNGGVVISVFDNFDDANADGTFSGTLDYTLIIDEYVLNDIQPVMQACDDGDGCTNTDMQEVFPCSTGDVVCGPCAGIQEDCATGPTTATTTCDDGDPCTTNDVEETLNCDGSSCGPCAGTPLDCASGPTTVQACDDGDPCTENDMETTLDCDNSVCVPCAGTPVAACSGAVANIVQACDDGDPCTANDMEELDGCDGVTACVPCAGTTVDCMTGPSTVQACDDGDPCTENDMETVLDCDGSVCVPCAGVAPNPCSGALANVVQACDDGDPCTINDMEEVDGCDGVSVCVPCAGEVVGPPEPSLTCPTTLDRCNGEPFDCLFDDLNPLTEGDTEASPIIGGPDAGVVSSTGIIDPQALAAGTYTFTLTYEYPVGCIAPEVTCTFTVAEPLKGADAGNLGGN